MYATIMIQPEGQFYIASDSNITIRDDNTFVMGEGDLFFHVFSRGDRLTITKNGRPVFSGTISDDVVTIACKECDIFTVTPNLSALCAFEVATSRVNEDWVGDSMTARYLNAGSRIFAPIEVYNESRIAEIAREHGFAVSNVTATPIECQDLPMR